MAWSRQTFWFELNFLLPKNESVLKILLYFLEQFQRCSQGLQPLEYTLKCSQLISSSDNKKILLTTRNVRLDSGGYATKYYNWAMVSWNSRKNISNNWQPSLQLFDASISKICIKLKSHDAFLRTYQNKKKSSLFQKTENMLSQSLTK